MTKQTKISGQSMTKQRKDYVRYLSSRLLINLGKILLINRRSRKVMEGFGLVSKRGRRIYKEGLFPSEWFSFLPLFLPQSTPETSHTREILLVYLFYNTKTLYLYDSHLNYFHLSSSHKKLKA